MTTLRYPIGEYKRPVQIEARPADRAEKPDRNQYQEETGDDWRPVAKCWARVMPLNTQETWRAQQATAATTHQVNLRGCFPWLSTRHRLRLGTRVLNIEGVTDLGDMHTEQELRCIEVQLKPGERAG